MVLLNKVGHSDHGREAHRKRRSYENAHFTDKAPWLMAHEAWRKIEMSWVMTHNRCDAARARTQEKERIIVYIIYIDWGRKGDSQQSTLSLRFVVFPCWGPQLVACVDDGYDWPSPAWALRGQPGSIFAEPGCHAASAAPTRQGIRIRIRLTRQDLRTWTISLCTHRIVRVITAMWRRCSNGWSSSIFVHSRRARRVGAADAARHPGATNIDSLCWNQRFFRRHALHSFHVVICIRFVRQSSYLRATVPENSPTRTRRVCTNHTVAVGARSTWNAAGTKIFWIVHEIS